MPISGARISSGFGYRTFDHSFHKGIDYAAPTGTPYYAAADGVVVVASYHPSAGNWIIISHGNGMVTKYMHSSRMLVHVGQRVHRGQNIGLVGSTGNSTGPHLHFQVDVGATNPFNGTAVNPANYY